MGADWTASINHWVLENLYLIPLTFICLFVAVHQETKKAHKRIDAILELLKQRGIDLLD